MERVVVPIDDSMPIDDLRAERRPEKKWLRLGAYQLPVPEMALIRAYFRLYAQNSGFHWNFVDLPPYDALLIDDSAADVEPVLGQDMPAASIRVTKEKKDNPEAYLTRPLRSDMLENWLRKVEYDHLQSALKALPALRAVTKASLSPQPFPAAAADISVKADGRSLMRFKLRRWPPAILLQKNLPRKTREKDL